MKPGQMSLRFVRVFKSPEKHEDYAAYQKEAMDYLEILRLCHSMGSLWTLILEDDAIAADQFLSKLRKAIQPLSPDSVAFIKLFYTSKAQAPQKI